MQHWIRWMIPMDCPSPPADRGRGAPPSPITLASVPMPPSTWAAEAHCKGTETHLWFSTGSVAPKAIEICTACPVRVACLEYAVKYHLTGTWAGTSKRQRDRMRSVIRSSLS